jgi:RNase P subunit RPR2
MPQRAHLIFGDVEGKLDVLRVECSKCGRKGRYSVRKLIEEYGRKAKMMEGTAKW